MVRFDHENERMMRAERPANESDRLAALDRYAILDTEREQEFDDITSLIANVCHTPMAVVNLIGNGRQWFKSEVGLGVRETPFDTSLCAHAILQGELFVIPDTTKDERFADNPLVTSGPCLRFYAAALLHTDDGFPLGTLAVMDVRPRQLEPYQLDALQTLARHVMNLLNLRRLAAQQAALTLRADLALQSQQRLLRTVLHDLRTPLAIVSMAATLLEGSAPDEETRPKMAARLRRASSSMTLLIDDLLDQASLEEGQQSLKFAECNVNELVESCVEALAALNPDIQVKLTLAEDPRLQAVRCDGARVGQIVANLVSNAFKFTTAPGTIEVSTSVQESQLKLLVRDSGTGISEAELPHVFEPYWRSASTRAKGTGLGLPIVKTLVERHGGTVSVESSLGVGTCFTVTLPLKINRDLTGGDRRTNAGADLIDR
jgi:signal transduction histidine kinase